MSASIKICFYWLVTSKMLEILDNVDIDLDYIDSDIVHSSVMIWAVLNTTAPNNISLDGNDDKDLQAMIHVRVAASRNEYKQRKAFKK